MAAIKEAVIVIAGNQKSLLEKITVLEAADEEKIADKAESTPRASLAEIIASSIIGKETVHVDGRRKENKGPKETPFESKNRLITTGSPFDGILADIVLDGKGE